MTVSISALIAQSKSGNLTRVFEQLELTDRIDRTASGIPTPSPIARVFEDDDEVDLLSVDTMAAGVGVTATGVSTASVA